ncbi:MAG: hypothetical protein JJT77_00685 [Crocinitomicaceae bacterium]|nr:hypothetical protein [Crocinitomicaceae bacterium]
MSKAQIQKEINELTEQLRINKPSIYKHLMENPLTIDKEKDSKLEDALKKYKDNLIALLRN